jgi:hypothetical protein
MMLVRPTAMLSIVVRSDESNRIEFSVVTVDDDDGRLVDVDVAVRFAAI